ncbi:MAG TPA: SRPBCC family protein [Chitinophagaceae bacterium]
MAFHFYSRTNGFSMWAAAMISAVINAGFTAWIVYGMGDYGFALFILVPLLIGMYAVLLYGWRKAIRFRDSRNVAFLSLGFYTLVLLFAAMEGMICIAMAMPFGILLTWIGSLVGMAFVKRDQGGTTAAVVLVTLMLPGMSFIEKDVEPSLTTVTTAVEINASPETVWKQLVAFPALDEPDELIFKAGIAYPTQATIEGSGVGAVRNCNFNTGSFVEPITVWDEPRLLAFNVKEQPAPMKELSMWKVNAPHLHDYFISRKGQFRLTRLPGNRTLLEGTTWYTHNIRPEFYWKLWSTYIVHKIHERVLWHIKRNAER